MDRYETQDRWIELGPGEKKEINFELIPKVERLFVETVPEGATVRILNIKPKFVQGMELEPGRYHVEVAAEEYETERRWIELTPGFKEPYRFELKKMPPKVGKIFVKSVPAEATVKILNVDQGFRQGMELGPGEYRLQVSSKGYYPQDRLIEISAGEEKQIAFELTPHKIITNKIGMKFVLIPAGKFVLGSPYDEPGRRNKEKQHEVRISRPFYFQTTEVSQGQWKRIMGNNPSKFIECGDNCPVETVSWDMVQEFIVKLNRMEGTNKYRLPTEAEWEYACRSGTKTAYSFGDETDELGEYAWYRINAEDQTHPVGKKKANNWGIYDMHGNVSEWVQKLFSDGPKSYYGRTRMYRGGSWRDFEDRLRSAQWEYGLPLGRIDIGFRVARDF
jgi:formylglycine-generating enzyme required for sulfatase activity